MGLYRYGILMQPIKPISAHCQANIYLFQVNYRNTRKRSEICSKLTIKTSERRH